MTHFGSELTTRKTNTSRAAYRMHAAHSLHSQPSLIWRFCATSAHAHDLAAYPLTKQGTRSFGSDVLGSPHPFILHCFSSAGSGSPPQSHCDHLCPKGVSSTW